MLYLRDCDSYPWEVPSCIWKDIVFFSFADIRGTELGMNYYGIKAQFFIRMCALEMTLGLCIASSVCSHSALPLSVKCIRIWKAPVLLCLLPFCDFIRHCQQQRSKGSSCRYILKDLLHKRKYRLGKMEWNYAIWSYLR